MERQTNYYRAVHWLNNNLILCNEIPKIDNSIYDEMRFSLTDEDGCEIEIYQWFLTDCSQSDVEYLERSFGLLFTYSNVLDLYVLCVDHLGTMWRGVPCTCYNDDISDEYLKSED